MIATIEKGGRVVVPKEVRARLGLRPGSRVELTEVDGRLEIAPVFTELRLEERDAVIVAVAEVPMPPLSAERVREVLEAARR